MSGRADLLTFASGAVIAVALAAWLLWDWRTHCPACRRRQREQRRMKRQERSRTARAARPDPESVTADAAASADAVVADGGDSSTQVMEPVRSRCDLQWGLCPDHGATLVNDQHGMSRCYAIGCARMWDCNRAGSQCWEPVAVWVSDSDGSGEYGMCAGHWRDAEQQLGPDVFIEQRNEKGRR